MKQLFLIFFSSLSLFSGEYVYSPSEPTGNELLIPAPAKQDFQQKGIHNSGSISETVMSNDEEIPLKKSSISLSQQKEINNQNSISETIMSNDEENSLNSSIQENVMTNNSEDTYNEITPEPEEEFGDKDFNKFPLSVKEQVMN